MENIQKPKYLDRSSYFCMYIDLAIESKLKASLFATKEETLALIEMIPFEKENYVYAPGKWTIKQVLQHNIDTERILMYRALRICRNDLRPIEGFDENEYAKNDASELNSLENIRKEFLSVRQATIDFYSSISEEALHRKTLANNLEVSPCILGWIISGHTRHHLNVLNNKYLIQ